MLAGVADPTDTVEPLLVSPKQYIHYINRSSWSYRYCRTLTSLNLDNIFNILAGVVNPTDTV